MFVNGQVYFRCQRAIWREDMYTEHPSVDHYLGETKIRVARDEPSVDQYQNIVRRVLTYQSDTLNAFAGLSKFLGSTLDTNMYFGLPQSIFPRTILWEVRDRMQMQRREEFPSWSWAGWIVELLMPLPPPGHKIYDWIKHHTWIDWYMVPEHPIFRGLLRFRTLFALYHLAPPRVHFSRLDLANEGDESLRRCRPLHDSRGVRCGFIRLEDPDTFEHRFRGQGEAEVEILILSDATVSRTVGLKDLDLSYNDIQPGSSQEATEWPLVRCSGREGKSEEGYGGVDAYTFSLYNVMLVWVKYILTPGADGDEVQVIRERVGLGLMHYKALKWGLPPGPQWKEILLY